MRNTALGIVVSAVFFTVCASARADCVAQAFRSDDFPDDPIYEVVSCGPASLVVEKLREANPNWFGTFTYSLDDVVVTVAAANEDARRLMWADIEHWYYPGGCSDIREGMLFYRPQLSELCCDVGPVSTLPCGVGGKTLMESPR